MSQIKTVKLVGIFEGRENDMYNAAVMTEFEQCQRLQPRSKQVHANKMKYV